MKLSADQVTFDDGKFEMLLIPNPKTLQALQNLIHDLLTQNFSGEGVIFRHVSALTAESDEQFPWSLDGEYGEGGESVEIRNLRRRLTFLL